MSAKKAKNIQPKKIWAFRISHSMLAEISRLAAEREMRPSEYVRRIIEAGKLLDIELLDHIVIGGSKIVSLRDEGLGFAKP